MSIVSLTLIPLYLILLNLNYITYVFATEQPPPQTYPYPWAWEHGMHWPAFWWIFPLLFFVIMIVLFILIIKKGGMSCSWGDRMMDASEYREAVKRYVDEQSDTALEILNKRYAKGEIDKQEYEDKKSAITDSK